MIVIAHNIRSLHNVGAILRNCASFGVEKVYLTGITGTPPRKEIAKVSLGAELLIPWETGDITSIIKILKSNNYRILALDNTKNAIDISSITSMKKDVLILGNEIEGIEVDVLTLTDHVIMIPMAEKQSLNVSVASGIALFALRV